VGVDEAVLNVERQVVGSEHVLREGPAGRRVGGEPAHAVAVPREGTPTRARWRDAREAAAA
jgi:hypothetical protein